MDSMTITRIVGGVIALILLFIIIQRRRSRVR
jgi:hypothetical protein